MGLGRVKDYSIQFNWIQVETYFNSRGCKWDADNVQLIKIGEIDEQ